MKQSEPDGMDRLMEAGWLMAVVTIPLYFNVYTSRIFETDKSFLTVSFALLILAAWTASALDRWIRRNRRSAGIGSGTGKRLITVYAAIGLFALSVLVSTIFSVHIPSSLFGSFERGRGLLAVFSTLSIGLAIAFRVRRRDQIERIVSAMVLSGTAVALYGILQHFGTDPIPWGADAIFRVSSTQGNPIFVGAFLILTVPAVLYRLSTAFSECLPDAEVVRSVIWLSVFLSIALLTVSWFLSPRAGTAAILLILPVWVIAAPSLGLDSRRAARLGMYSVLFSVQLVTVLFAQSRGPLVGLAAAVGLTFFVVWSRRVSRVIRVGAVFALTAVLFSAAIVLRSPSVQQRIESVPYLGRFASSLSIRGTGQVRLLIWEGVIDLFRENHARLWTGFGPETMQFVFPTVYSPELAHVERREAVPDRAHNEMLDNLVRQGIPGLLLWLFTFMSLFSIVLPRTGVGQRGPPGYSFWISVIGIPIVFLMAAWWLDGTLRLLGLSLSFGLITGLVLFITTGSRPTPSIDRSHPGPRYLSVAILGALSAHLVETQFGFETASTMLYFWIWVGVLIAIERCGFGAESIETESAPEHNSRHRIRQMSPDVQNAPSSAHAEALLSGAVCLLLVSNFVRLPDVQYTVVGITWLILLFWCIAFGMVWSESGNTVDERTQTNQAIQYIVFSTIPMVLFLGVFRLKAPQIAPDTTFFVVLGILGGVLLALSSSVRSNQKKVGADGRKQSLSTGMLLIPLALLPVFRYTVQPVLADISLSQARGIERTSGVTESALGFFEKAVRLEPSRAEYRFFLGSAYFTKASQDTTHVRDEWYQRALDAYGKASALNPADPDYPANRARVLIHMAGSETETANAQDLYEKAFSILLDVAESAPGMVQRRVEAGQTASLAGHDTTARRLFEQSIALDPRYLRSYLSLGAYFMSEDSVDAAEEVFQQALLIEPENLEVLLRLGEVELIRGRNGRARDYFDRVLTVDPENRLGLAGFLRSLLENGDCRGAFEKLREIRAVDDLNWVKQMVRLTYDRCSKPTGSGE